MTTAEILNSNLNKTEKIKRLLALNYQRKYVAQLVGTNYGMVQNIYAKTMKKTNKRNCEEYLFEWTRFDEATETDVPAQTLITFTYDYEKGYTSLNYYEPNEPDYIEVTIHETKGDALDEDAYNDATYEIEQILLEEFAA